MPKPSLSLARNLLTFIFCLFTFTFFLPALARAVSPDRYRIHLAIDFDGRAFAGTERVRWTNTSDHPVSVLFFHLYANQRPETEASSAAATVDPSQRAFEPSLEITEVRSAVTGQPLTFSLEDKAVTLRVQLRETVAARSSTEIEIRFKGRVPEIDADETSLSAHVVQQVGAALRDTREWRRARDINFFSRGVMLLGTAYPVLAVYEDDNWRRKVEGSVGDVVHTEAADYEVTIDAPTDMALFTSAEELSGTGESPPRGRRIFAGENLRNFAVVAGRSLRSAERTVAGVRVRSVYVAEHETVGRRVLEVAAEATRVYVARFGALPLKLITIAEAPLVAGHGNAEFGALSVIASAFYVDFDAPTTRNLPELVREQRASVEDSLQFTTAHLVAHQWWGGTVGSDPERAPVLDEALAHWSALVYYEDVQGQERARLVLEDQLRGVYQIYRTLGGEDMAAERAAREYRNSFQYAAIVASKGALMFAALRTQVGDAPFFAALRRYYEANRHGLAQMSDLQAAFLAETSPAARRDVQRTFNRWLSEKYGDEDIAPPNPQLPATLGLAVERNGTKDRNAFSRVGRFFWRHMGRIR